MFKIGDRVQTITGRIRGVVTKVEGETYETERVHVDAVSGVISVFWAVDLRPDSDESVFYDYINTRVARKDR